MKRIFLSLLLVFLLVTPSFAAIHYIRAGASGTNDGTSWVNAWTSLKGKTWTRGDTYYIAGGAYAGATIDPSDVWSISSSGSSGWVTIKKANATDNSGDAGWDAAYATTQAVITGFLILDNGYIEINGVTGSNNSGHGIKIYMQEADEAHYWHTVQLSNSTGPYHLYNLEIQGPAASGNTTKDCIYYGVGTKGLHISSCYVHQCDCNALSVSGAIGSSYSDYGLLFDGNYVELVNGAGPEHGQTLKFGSDGYHIISNNTFKDGKGNAYISYLGGADTNHNYARIYNNVFWGTSGGVSYLIWASDSAVSVTNIQFYHNTIYDVGVSNAYLWLGGVSVSNNEQKNNLYSESVGVGTVGVSSIANNDFYNCTGVPSPPETGQLSESAEPMTDPANGVFTLKAGVNAINAGVDLTSIVPTDKAGNTRNSPDIGAYEFSGSTSWGHSVSATEPTKLKFADTWTCSTGGTTCISGSGDEEKITLAVGDYAYTTNCSYVGANKKITLKQSYYRAGENVTVKYRTGTSNDICKAASWSAGNTASSFSFWMPAGDTYIGVRVEK